MIVERSTEALGSVAEDFGHVFRGAARGMIRPRSPAEVAEAVTDALSTGSKLTLRALGHSAGGQSLPSDSVVVDLSGMGGVGARRRRAEDGSLRSRRTAQRRRRRDARAQAP